MKAGTADAQAQGVTWRHTQYLGRHLPPVESRDDVQTTSFPGLQAGGDADARTVAARVARIWRDIDAALAPIVGHRGLAALYGRSLHLAGQAHPWLIVEKDLASASLDIVALRDLLSRQPGAEAAAAGDLLLRTFERLLISLIGPGLTQQLLHSVWEGLSHGSPAQDTSP